MSQADIGLIGLAVMGENLVLNMESKGFTVAVLQPHRVARWTTSSNGRAKGKKIIGCHSHRGAGRERSRRPRKVMLMVKAGKAVDDFIEQLLPHLEPGDIIIDGGNTHFPDTIRRTAVRREQGPALHRHRRLRRRGRRAARARRSCPAASPAAWPHVKPIFQAIAAKTADGEPCCDWVGENGAGHFVKMVHNGIEYGDMQLICEAYQLMKDGLGLTNDGDARGLRRVEQGRAGQLPDRDHPRHPRLQGRGRQAARRPDPRHRRARRAPASGPAIAALDAGHAADADRRGGLRALPVGASRTSASRRRKVLHGPDAEVHGRQGSSSSTTSAQALYASKIVSYAQGYQLMRAAAKEYELEPELRRHRADVARRLHHPLGLPRQDQGGLRQEPGPGQPAARPVLQRRRSRGARPPGGAWSSTAVVNWASRCRRSATRAGLLRRLPHRAPAGQPAAGPARLLRRPHLRARRQAARPVLPHQLDRPRRDDLGLDLHRLGRYPVQPMTAPALDELCVNTIRALSIDAVQKANSGHPGLPMGAAPIGYSLFARTLRHSPGNPHWPDRDRFVLSAGHGSMLLYSLLHLTGYDLPLDELKRFRQWGSRTPGHPEHGDTPGVETTTGPLGQGFGNAVGMAIAERHLAARFNRPGHDDRRPPHLRPGRRRRPDGGRRDTRPPRSPATCGLGQARSASTTRTTSRLAGSTSSRVHDGRGAGFEAYGWHVQHGRRRQRPRGDRARDRRGARRVGDRPSL